MKKSTTFVYELNGQLYINLTNRCSNDCTFCLRNTGEGVKQSTLWLEHEPSYKEVVAQIKAADFDYSEAVFCGYGESTYRLRELKDVALFLKSINKTTRLNTNGLGNLINKTDISDTLKTCIDSVSVSLNAGSAEQYQSLCRSIFGKESFDRIIEFSALCVQKGIDTTLSVVDVISESEIEKCRQIAAKIGAKFKIREHIKNNESYS